MLVRGGAGRATAPPRCSYALPPLTEAVHAGLRPTRLRMVVAMMLIDHAGLHELFAKFARSLVDGYQLRDVITDLGWEICTTLGVAGAGVMVEDDDGDLRFMSTSDETLRTLEQLQVELGEGPCLMAFRKGEPVIAGDLREDDRFKRFGPLAVAAGMRAVYSFPMIQTGTPIGAMNFYRSAPGPLTDEQATVGRMFADVAAAFIVHAREDDHRALLNRQLQTALDSRVLIEQAKGYVMARLDVGSGDAFEALRRHARNNSLKLHDVARAILDGTKSVDELGV